MNTYPFLDIFTEVNCHEVKRPLLIPGDMVNPAFGRDWEVFVFGNPDDMTEQDKELFSDAKLIPLPPYEVSGKTEEEVYQELNDDAWEVLLAAATDKNVVVFDSQSDQEFTQRLVGLMYVTMQREMGGNSTSLNRGRLTDLYVRQSKAKTFTDQTVPESRVKIHPIEDKLWDRLEAYYLNELGGTLADQDKNLVVGICATTNDAFFRPVFSPLTYDEVRGVYKQETGMGVLDNRKVLLGSF